MNFSNRTHDLRLSTLNQLTPLLSSISESPPMSYMKGQSSSSSSLSSLSSLSFRSSLSSSLSSHTAGLLAFLRSSSSISTGPPLLLTLRLRSRYFPALPLLQLESSQKSQLLIYKKEKQCGKELNLFCKWFD